MGSGGGLPLAVSRFSIGQGQGFPQESNDCDAQREEMVRKGISAATYSPTQ